MSVKMGTDPITGADITAAVVYRIADADGRLWRSAPAILNAAFLSQEINLNANGQWIRIPTLRHLLPGTVAQIELYVGTVDLQIFRVFANDPTVDYIEVCPQLFYLINDIMIQMAVALVFAGVAQAEMLYTTGSALPNDPPPACSTVSIWRNRAIACGGDSIWPSQEFATGIGIQWNSTLRTDWLEGTGDIVGAGPIDWNYFAILKKDAICIISGPGPDGMGHGAYIVQTLPTKDGCTNPQSIVNGGDGLYFQSAATGRLMCITPQLQVVECAPGWFNGVETVITCAMQVEPIRQVWFSTNDGQIIVIDYKHKTESCPFGEVYHWDLTATGIEVMGMAMGNAVSDGVGPLVVFSDGSIGITDTTQPFDVIVEPGTQGDGTHYPILQSWETGELQPFNLQGMGDICKAQLLGEYIAPHTLSLTVFPQFSTTGNDPVSKVMNAGPEQIGHRPPNCQRVQSIRLRIDEIALPQPGRILVTVTTVGATVANLTSGHQLLEITCDGIVYAAHLYASDFATAAGVGDHATELQCSIVVPAGQTITQAHISPIDGFQASGLVSAMASVRRKNGTAGEILDGTGADSNLMNTLPGNNVPSGQLTLASSLESSPDLGAGLKLIGVALEVQARGRAQTLDVGSIV